MVEGLDGVERDEEVAWLGLRAWRFGGFTVWKIVGVESLSVWRV